MGGYNSTQLDPERGSLPERNDGTPNSLSNTLITFHFNGNYTEEYKKRFQNIQNVATLEKVYDKSQYQL